MFIFQDLSTSVEGNVFASTYSIQLLLLLLTIGSKSKTYDELTNVLNFSKKKPPTYEKIRHVIESVQVRKFEKLCLSNKEKKFNIKKIIIIYVMK